VWLHVNGILADANCEGHLALLLRLFQEGWRHGVWEACQREQVILLTANRNDDGPDSLEATIQQHNTPASLPVFTLANEQRVLRDRLYAEAVADRLLELLFDIDSYRGTGRLYLPS